MTTDEITKYFINKLNDKVQGSYSTEYIIGFILNFLVGIVILLIGNEIIVSKNGVDVLFENYVTTENK